MSGDAGAIFIGASGKGKTAKPQHLHLRYANRHGLIAGATGTGKTVTLRVLAEGLSAAGVPVFIADIKGDLSGIGKAGATTGKLAERAKDVGLKDYAPTAFPTVFWDVFGEQGHPVRATISEMGPLLLARLLELTDAQEGVLNIVFKIADDEGLLLLDLKDLRALLSFVGERAQDLTTRYGNITKASAGAIQRRLLTLEQQGGEAFFGEPALELADLMKLDAKGRGQINILVADKLIQGPRVYVTFLLWLLAELFEELPEIGDVDKPKLVFFFDEAHLLFNDAPKALVDKVEQVVRLIRSKGVGVYFVTQSPLDLPEKVLGQLGNRVQHALRAFTPKDQKTVRAAAETFPKSPGLDTATALTQLAIGEALLSALEGQGTPSPVKRAFIRPPASRLEPLSAAERQDAIDRSPLHGKYEDTVDRESAHEMLAGRTGGEAGDRTGAEEGKGGGILGGPWAGTRTGTGGRGRTREGLGEAMMKSVARSIGSAIGRQIVRGVLGAILKGR